MIWQAIDGGAAGSVLALGSAAAIGVTHGVRHDSLSVFAGYRDVLISATILVYAWVTGQWFPVDG
jgi:hypothetical protein